MPWRRSVLAQTLRVDRADMPPAAPSLVRGGPVCNALPVPNALVRRHLRGTSTVSTSYQSDSTHLFLDSALALADRLEREPSEAAHHLAREARELAARFIEWQTARPADEVRVATIQRLFEINRRAMDYVAA